KAFNTVNHQHIFWVLAQKGVDKHIINIICDLYTNCGTAIEMGGQCRERIKILGGVKQGDPMSPIFFNLALDPLLYGEQVVSLALVDDLTLLSNSWDSTKRNIEVVEEF
ncbi:PO23 protein, partial [Crypturellus undulatus]|nr:PO23 protein [Crypturellus undulatus]